MDEEIQDVERLLGTVAQKCNVRGIEREAANMAKWTRGVEAQGTYTRETQSRGREQRLRQRTN